MKLFKSKKQKIKEYMQQRQVAMCNVIARANKMSEIKKMLNDFDKGDPIVLFLDKDKNPLEIVMINKGVVNKNAGQLPSKKPKPLKYVNCVYITLA